MIEQEEAAATRQSMIAASFTAWQLQEGGTLPFGKYLDKLGLGESTPKMTKAQKVATLEKALTVAERVSKAMQAGKYTTDPKKVDLHGA